MVTRVLKKVLSVCVSVLLMAIVVMTFAQVLVRFIIPGVSVPWIEELARYSLVFVSFFATTLVYYERGHVYISNFVEAKKLPKSAKRVIGFISRLFELVFFIIMAYGGFMYLPAAAKNASTVLKIPLNRVYIIVPICAILMGIRAVVEIIEWARGKEEIVVDEELEAIIASAEDSEEGTA